jgi:hypothetical protein
MKIMFLTLAAVLGPRAQGVLATRCPAGIAGLPVCAGSRPQ